MRISPCPLTCLLASLALIPPASAEVDTNYAYCYFENGHPPTLGPKRRQFNAAYEQTRENPDIIIETGHYSLRLECDTVRLSGFDSLQGTDYLSALTNDVTSFTGAVFELSAFIGNVEYTCRGAELQDNENQYFRFIEGGQYVQRFDLTRLRFVSAGGSEFSGRLEVTAWPDHVTFTLDCSEEAGVTSTTIRLTPPGREALTSTRVGHLNHLSTRPHQGDAYEGYPGPGFISEARRSNGATLPGGWDEELAGLKIALPTPNFSFTDTATRNTVYEYTFKASNPTNATLQLPLVFAPSHARHVTGTSMVLCRPDGSPSGIPVQLSKNWHGTAGSTPHAGRWIRGYTMIPLAPGETRDFRLRIVYGYWGNGTVAAVSHSSLSLIGWSTRSTWKWDEAALGAWGESMTYDISQHAGGAVIGDVRPTFTTPFNGGTEHNWTENVGGGDFLNYTNSANLYIPSKRLKTCYQWTGPNMTEVHYSGITADNKIRFICTTRGVATLDYHRRFHSYRYEFLEEVTNPRRLTFFQTAADYYMTTSFADYYLGDAEGKTTDRKADPGGNSYKEPSLPFSSGWIAINDLTTSTGHPPNGYRGLIAMSSTLNGQPLETRLHPYGRTWGQSTTIFDLSSESVRRSYAAGDVVEGKLAFILPAKSPAVYWGEDNEFSNRIAGHNEPWQAVHDEYRYNSELDLTVERGTLNHKYPLDLTSTGQNVLAQFSINSGGIGHLPVIVRNVSPQTTVEAQRFLNGSWQVLEGVTSPSHDYYQGYYNASGTIDYAFSLKRPTPDLTQPWKIRIVAPGLQSGYDLWRLNYFGSTDNSGEGADGNDANGNGLSNLLDFAYGFSPTGLGSAGASLEVSNPGPDGVITSHGGLRFWAEPGSGRVFMRYARRADHQSMGLSFAHQFSRDLDSFESLPGQGEIIARGAGDDGVPVEAVQVPLPLVLPGSGGRARYGRTEVSLTP